jgi:hypothetical protein
VVLRRDQARIDLQTAGLDREVVEAAAEVDTPHLDHPQAPALGPVVDRRLLQPDDAMDDRVELQVLGRAN